MALILRGAVLRCVCLIRGLMMGMRTLAGGLLSNIVIVLQVIMEAEGVVLTTRLKILMRMMTTGMVRMLQALLLQVGAFMVFPRALILLPLK